MKKLKGIKINPIKLIKEMGWWILMSLTGFVAIIFMLNVFFGQMNIKENWGGFVLVLFFILVVANYIKKKRQELENQKDENVVGSM